MINLGYAYRASAHKKGMPKANSKGQDQPAHVRSLIRAFTVSTSQDWTLRSRQAQKAVAGQHGIKLQTGWNHDYADTI